MKLIDDYIDYVRDVRRYSERTASIYEEVLDDYHAFVSREIPVTSDVGFAEAFNVSEIRGYVVHMMDDRKMSAKTVNLHMSSLSGFCRYLMKRGFLKSNPVRLVSKPKNEKRLPKFYREEAMQDYFNYTSHVFDESEFAAFLSGWDTKTGKDAYSRIVERVVISALYSLGVRRSELIGMRVGDVDFGRKVVKVRGKGDKMREIPLVDSLSEEILLYLKAVEVMCGRKRSLTEPLFVTYSGSPLYPNYVDRVVKSALGGVRSIRGQKSPHVLRHSWQRNL